MIWVADREVLPSAHEMTEFLESWKCDETAIALCSLSLAKEFSRRRLWSEQDVTAIEVWINELEQVGYEFPAMSTSNLECAFMYSENTKGQNCRPVGIDFASSTHKSSVGSNLVTASEKIEAFRALDTWCSESGYG
ncbi:hypothetical protein ANCDUO_11423 [Ancylostoma duodenale]|uniref:Uncharacterized protein n=1 Tax=Ancylostoma duodenale TaxID=51022 RepID=A0A0C2GN38_9BILA|nr:hypothetical protein ANCDUO_11423 [Ancylostoma duodenale]